MLRVSPEFLADLGKLSGESWRSLGVERPFIIMITGRCGSTYLSHILGDAKLTGTPREFFSEDTLAHFTKKTGAQTIAAYFNALVSTFGREDSFGFKINPTRFFWLERLLTETNLLHPDALQWIDMRRSDLVAQGVSFARARVSGRWHKRASVTDAPPEEELLEAETLDDATIWQQVFEIVSQEQKIDAYYKRLGIRPLRVTYETLMASRAGTVDNVLFHAGVPIEDIALLEHNFKDRTASTRNDSVEQHERAFSLRYAQQLNTLYRNRSKIDLRAFGRRELSDLLL